MPVAKRIDRRALIAAVAISTFFGIASLKATVVGSSAQAADKKAASQPLTPRGDCRIV